MLHLFRYNCVFAVHLSILHLLQAVVFICKLSFVHLCATFVRIYSFVF